MRELEETLTPIQKQFSIMGRKIQGYALSDFSVKEKKVKKSAVSKRIKILGKCCLNATGEE